MQFFSILCDVNDEQLRPIARRTAAERSLVGRWNWNSHLNLTHFDEPWGGQGRGKCEGLSVVVEMFLFRLVVVVVCRIVVL